MKNAVYFVSIVLVCVLQGFAGINDGLVAHYLFDGNANDASGNGNNGTAYNISYVAGRDGQVALFNGNNAYAEVPDNSSLNLQRITVSAWVSQPDIPASTRYLISKDKGTGFQMYMGAVAFGVTTTPYSWPNAICSTPLATDTWYHIAGTFDGNVIKVFVNGQEVGRTNYSGGISYDPGSMQIGRSSWDFGEYFKGMIDDLRIYNRALSLLEIRQLASGYPFADISLVPKVKWESSPGTNYQVQWCTNLLVNDWYNLGQPVATNCLVDPTENCGRRFYRVFPFNISEGLVAYYPFDGNTYDLSGNGLNGVTKNGASFSTNHAPVSGGSASLSLDGVDDLAVFPATDAVYLQQFTIHLWIRLNVIEAYDIISKGPDLTAKNFRIQMDGDGHLYGFFNYGALEGDVGVNSTAALMAGQWYVIDMAYDGSMLCIYVNGMLEGTTYDKKLPGNTGLPITVGDSRVDWPDHPVDGLIDEVRVYNRALSSFEVSALCGYQ